MKMSTPIVDSVPTVAENCGIKMQQDTGFPFEDDFDDRHSFRSQLDEIAQRHPEFAQHLHFDQFPARGRRRRGSDERTQPQPPPENRRFERPFRSRFEEFGFPFGRDFEEPQFYREEVPQYQEYQHQHPPQESQQETARETEEKSEKDAAGLNKNIQQSNTVDLGKNQEPVDDQRGQRSMSAPPENRPAQQRFVSSINIPVQTQTAGGPSGDMGAKPSQPQSEKPMERVIPIHVEGRDEPVIPKNPYFTATQQQPQPERIFGRNPSHFTQFLNKGEPQMTPEEYFKPQQRNYQQKHQQNFQDQPPQPSPQHDKHQEKEKQQEEQQQPPQKSTQLDQIQNIQKDVSELMNQVEKFEGKLKDKQYLYLDEMLTRNLIKLDNIETEGKENIRQARKEAIKCIESCIAILEAKANANYAKEKQQQEESMEVEKQSPEQPEKQDDQSQEEQNEAKNDTKDQAIEEKEKQPHHKEKEDETKEEQTLEVSGVARSGTIANIEVPSTTPMEVTAESENVETKEEEEKKEEVMPPGEAVPEIEEKVEEKKEKKKTTKKKEKADKK